MLSNRNRMDLETLKSQTDYVQNSSPTLHLVIQRMKFVRKSNCYDMRKLN